VSAKRARRWLGDRSGATAAEFALALPVFVVMLFGIFEFGWTQHCLSATRYAMEIAARDLMLNPNLTETQLETRVREQLQQTADPNVDITLSVADGPAGKIATLTGVYVRQIGIPMLPTFPINHTVSVETALPAVSGA
jgi:Flp pilus assembly protein TadG